MRLDVTRVSEKENSFVDRRFIFFMVVVDGGDNGGDWMIC